MFAFTRLPVIMLLFALAGVPRVAIAQNPETDEQILLPISICQEPGAFGSLWSTELWMRNNSDIPVHVRPLYVSDAPPVARRTAFLPVGCFPASSPGTIVYVSPRNVQNLQFDLRLHNVADPQSGWGTRIPVVREHQFAGALNLINVPTSSAFRSALRIYAWPRGDSSEQVEAHVRIYDHSRDQLLGSAEVSLEGWLKYASILSLVDMFPQLGSVERVRVHVESVDEDQKLWAFVSVVSNSTQSVEIVTPD